MLKIIFINIEKKQGYKMYINIILLILPHWNICPSRLNIPIFSNEPPENSTGNISKTWIDPWELGDLTRLLWPRAVIKMTYKIFPGKMSNSVVKFSKRMVCRLESTLLVDIKTRCCDLLLPITRKIGK